MNEQRAKEPSTAPQPEQWYPIELGASFRSRSSSRFYSLRYEFKPASIDTSRPASLHKSSDSKVTVEFLNNQPGKSKVSFQGNIEDCKELDSILIFDGKSFRLEHLHKAVKSLRHVRLLGENNNNNSALAAGGTSNADHPSPPPSLNGAAPSAPHSNFHIERIPDKGVSVQVEEIVLGPTDASAGKNNGKRKVETKLMEARSSPEEETASVAKSNHEAQIEVDEAEEEVSGKRPKLSESQMIQNVVDEIFEENESDYEIEHVDVSEDEGVVVNAAEALRAQTAAEKQKQQSSSESGSTRSGSSGSDSGSSSSGSDGSDDEEDSATSGDDV